MLSQEFLDSTMIHKRKSEGEKNGKNSNAMNVSVWSESSEKRKIRSDKRRNKKHRKSGSVTSASSKRKEKDMRM
ncbi:hypothetical protein BGX38DRAFT_1212343, partial [Terfezia claveryi]